MSLLSPLNVNEGGLLARFSFDKITIKLWIDFHATSYKGTDYRIEGLHTAQVGITFWDNATQTVHNHAIMRKIIPYLPSSPTLLSWLRNLSPGFYPRPIL